ncbi:bifunctional diaminohydroxyphosphoribosylaminopyrimidine deaminase/5-amino-6-(5-phosphoribosylamino)uracil reductase RibD [bacterium]|nr:bifunctional diaminohydroxyphosphoribosylaminopyrimidine deaminase/5-amino-6-(5-phosphoribosylamino)uracil reductase RibD [candidate division CSSED10-310 bacterium]
MMMILEDTKWMRRAIRLSAGQHGKTHPNPSVGCVIVKDGTLLSEGCHRGPGTPHAELDAISRCTKDRLRGATCYVTLEPCNHFGRTPPCTDAILEAGISRVVFALTDPNPSVVGGGADRLRRMGVTVESGILAESASTILESWMKWIVTGRPFVLLKMAMSLDGRVATKLGESRWISGERSRALVHRLRAHCDGIMAGAGTVIADNPELTARKGNRVIASPLRIIIDHNASLPAHLNVFDPNSISRTLWVVPESRFKSVCSRNNAAVKVIACPEKRSGLDLEFVLDYLGGEEGLESVLLEGGPTLAFSMIHDDLVDKLMLFIAPIVIGGTTAPSAVGGDGFGHLRQVPRLNAMKVRKIAEDVLIEGYLGRGPVCSRASSGKWDA